MKKNKNQVYPLTVNVIDENGNEIKVNTKKLLEHEESIIEDNIEYAYLHDYSDVIIDMYESEARHELKALKKAIRENLDVKLKLNEITERFEVFNQEKNVEKTL